jgi:protein O-mannosyl-transferase
VDTTANSTRGGRPGWAWAALIVGVVGFVFQSARHGALLQWDDDINIVQNHHLRGLNWNNLVWMFTDFDYMRRYVPLTWLDWAIDYELFGLTARSCHVGNLLFHAANSVLVFLLVARVLQIWREQRGAAVELEPVITWTAGIAALGWAVHPLRVEVVAWASGRIYCQSAFFLLLATVAYLNAAGAHRVSRTRWLAISLGAFAASLLTYPLGITFVAVLLVIDVYLLRRFHPSVGMWRDTSNRSVWLEKIPFFSVTLLVVGVTLLARFYASGLWEPPPTLAEFGVGSRIAQGLYIWSYYVWRPWAPFDLAPAYSTLISFKPTDGPFLTAGVVVIGITSLLIWKRREWPAAFALWLAHLAMLAPMLGLTEHPHYPNDRYSYLEGVLWSIALAAGLLGLRSHAQRFVAAALGGVVATVLSLQTTAQIGIWRDSETLFRYLYARFEDSAYRADIAMRLGDVLRLQLRYNEAAYCYVDSLRINPVGTRAAVPHFGLALIAAAHGNHDVAVTHGEQAARLDPAWREAGELLARLRAGK